MRVLLSTFGSRGDVQPLLALAVSLRALGADARVCAPPDDEFVKLFAAAGVPLLPAFRSVRDWLAEMWPKRGTISLPDVAAQVMAAQYKAITMAAHGCDVIVATGLFSSVAAARSVAEKQGIRYVHAAYCPIFLPSPDRRPFEYPTHPHPAEVTDNRVLWKRDVQIMNELFGVGLNTLRAAVGLPAVDNVRDHCITDRPMLAADPVLAPWREHEDLDVTQTGAWILPDERPLPADLGAFSMPVRRPYTSASEAFPRQSTSRTWRSMSCVRKVAACSCRVVGRSLHWWMTPRIASSSARSTSRRCSLAWPRSFTTAVPVRRRQPLGLAVPS